MPPQKHQKKKARLDKFYHLAKEHGYRSRASFKLIQINKKYDFLSKAKCIIDLCAAPGGWLQVCSKYMPAASIKIGVDLDPIKSIKGCVTFQQDITTPKCLALLKKEMKHFKADAVLNDGAPNVGQEWSKDAFTQAELSLYALKIATETLRKGGMFVTKVFRSQDYNSLLFVLNHLFTKVEANKPQASRSQSAEIFVVCLGYKAPDYIDPKFLDPKSVFEDIEVEEETNQKISSIKKLMDTKKRDRQGYGNRTILYEEADFTDFMDSSDPYQFLSTVNKFHLDQKYKQEIVPVLKVPKELDEIVRDIKVLGKREMEILLRYRYKYQMIKQKARKADLEEKKKRDEPEKTEEQLEEEEEKELQQTIDKVQKDKKKREKKLAEKQMRNDITQKMSALTAVDMEAGDMELNFGRTFKKVQQQQVDIEDMSYEDLSEGDENDNKKQALPVGITEEDLKNDANEQKSDEMASDSEEEAMRRLNNLESGINNAMKMKKAYDTGNDKKKTAKEAKKKGLIDQQRTEKVDDWTTKLGNKEIIEADGENRVLSSDSDDEEEEEKPKSAMKTEKPKEKKKVKIVAASSSEDEETAEPKLFINPLANKNFKEDEPKENKTVDEDGYEWSSDEEENEKDGKKGKKDKKKGKFEKDKFEEVPQQKWDSDADDESRLDGEDFDGMDSDEVAETRALAKRMLRKKERESIIDGSYNRFSNMDPIEALPEWFLDDESKHYRPNIPISKEEFLEEKRSLQEFNARPIKKVAEAKARKKKKMQVALSKLKNRAQAIADQEIKETSKMKEIQKMYNKQLRKKKEEKKYVVNKAFGSPGGKLKTARGVKMVDKRLRADTRSKKIKKGNKKQKVVPRAKTPKGGKKKGRAPK